jgi:hypothetical protein
MVKRDIFSIIFGSGSRVVGLVNGSGSVLCGWGVVRYLQEIVEDGKFGKEVCEGIGKEEGVVIVPDGIMKGFVESDWELGLREEGWDLMEKVVYDDGVDLERVSCYRFR